MTPLYGNILVCFPIAVYRSGVEKSMQERKLVFFYLNVNLFLLSLLSEDYTVSTAH